MANVRDSAAQVVAIRVAGKDGSRPARHDLGVIRRQLGCIVLDPYANAFNDGPTGGQWQTDGTDMIPEVYERKWEIDSLCYPLRLAYRYWQVTGDDSIFRSDMWLTAVDRILATFADQQRKDGSRGAYRFLRVTDRALDTLNNAGWGAPVSGCGLIASAFRPSDDSTTLQYLVPANFFAVSSLRKAAEILSAVNGDAARAQRCTAMADEVEQALRKYATYEHPEFRHYLRLRGRWLRQPHGSWTTPTCRVCSAWPIWAMCHPTIPSNTNTRRLSGAAAIHTSSAAPPERGIGGPHVGYDMAWPMSIMMKAFTATDDDELRHCLKMLMDTDAGTGFMHESFNVNDATDFTREWFAWQNTLFGELIIKTCRRRQD